MSRFFGVIGGVAIALGGIWAGVASFLRGHKALIDESTTAGDFDHYMNLYYKGIKMGETNILGWFMWIGIIAIVIAIIAKFVVKKQHA